MPWTAYVVKHNPVVMFFRKDSTVFPDWIRKQIRKRLGAPLPKGDRTQDFLDRFLDVFRTESPPGYDARMLMEWLLANVGAGSDTTAIGLLSILYHLLKSPSKKRKLVEELQSSNLSYPVTWKESQNLPYLDACVKEGLRLHPSIGLGLERVTPKQGLQMPDGFSLPPGVKVSMNPWIVARHSVFGSNVDDFIPERWLQGHGESKEAFSERLNRMRRADLVFGGGSRSCTGKNIALLEIYKLIPTLFQRFDISLKDQDAEWKTENRWTVRQRGVECFIKRLKETNDG